MSLATDLLVLQTGYSFEQVAIAYGALALFAVAAVFILYRSRYHKLPAENARHKEALARSKHAQDPERVHLPGGNAFDAAEARERLREAVGDGPTISGTVGKPTFADAMEQARKGLSDWLAPIYARVPPDVLRYLLLALVVPPLGYVAVRTDWVVAALSQPASSPDTNIGPAAESAFQTVVGTTLAVALLVVDLLLMVPIVGPALSAAAVEIVAGLAWLYAHPIVVTGLLVGASAVLLVIEYRGRPYPADAVTESDLATARGTAFGVAKVLVIVWLWAVGPPLLGHLAGEPGLLLLIGTGLGILTLVLLTAWGVVDFLGDCWRVWHAQPALAELDHEPWFGVAPRPLLLAEVLFRRVVGVVVGVATTFVVSYAVVSVAEGRLFRVLEALASAPMSTQLLVLATALVPVAVLAATLRDYWGDIRAAVGDALARRGARAILLAKTTRWSVVAVAAVFGFGLTKSHAGAAVAAAVAWVGVLVIQRGLAAARVRASMVSTPDQSPLVIPVRLYTLVDANGREHPYAEIGADHAVSADGWIDTIDETVRVASELNDVGDDDLSFVTDPNGVLKAAIGVSDGERVEPSLASWHADRMLRFGIVDVEESQAGAREHARKVLCNTLRDNNGSADEETIEKRRRGEDVPPSEVDRWIDDERFFSRAGEYVRLVRDPWAK